MFYSFSKFCFIVQTIILIAQSENDNNLYFCLKQQKGKKYDSVLPNETKTDCGTLWPEFHVTGRIVSSLWGYHCQTKLRV